MTYYEAGPEAGAADAAAADASPGAETGPAEIAAELAAVRDQIGAVRDEMKAAGERAAAQERIIERLHEDNQKLRAGELRLVLLPLLTDLQRLRNDLLRQAVTLPAEMSAERMAGLLDSYAHSVELTLERGGVDVLRPEVGAAFDGSRHRPHDLLPAPGPELDGRVAAVLDDGYVEAATGRILTPATVRVHRWTEPPREETHA